MNMEVAPLVPQGAKNKPKKKRPGFRPIGKTKGKSGQNSSKATPKAAAPLEKPNDEDGPFVQEKDVEYKQSIENDKTPAAPPAAAEATDNSGVQKQTFRTNTTRKRKQSTSISIGLRTNNARDDANEENSVASKPRLARSSGETETAGTPTTNADTTTSLIVDGITSLPSAQRSSPRRSTALVVAQPPVPAPAAPNSAPAASQDQQILERLASENTSGVRLSSFCSAFKKKKQPRQKKGAGAGTTTSTTKGISSTTRSKKTTNVSNNDINSSTGNASTPDATGAPVVKIVDGEIVLQESSLVVPGQRRTVQEVEEEFQDVVEEDAQLAIVGASYNSFVNRKGPQQWTVKETKRFFDALRQMGTDFCSMEAFFENRTRKQLKRKYRQELVRNPALVEMALDPRNKTDVDLTIFNVEVDPKAIEEAAKDEPPPYIPTDVEEPPAPEPTNPLAPATEGATATITNAPDQEIVEEDAEEERREPGIAAKSQALSVSFANEEPSIWPTVYGNQDDTPADEINDDDFGLPEPSMDDFFQAQEEMIDPAEVAKEETATVAEKAPPAKTARASLPLIPPAKSNSKAKKPKFRTKTRKKK